MIAHKGLSRLVCEREVPPVILLIHPETAVNPTPLCVVIFNRFAYIHYAFQDRKVHKEA